MAITYEPIATTTLGTATTSITLSSIPSTFTDLRLIVSIQGLDNIATVNLRCNGDSGANYQMDGAGGSSAGSAVGFHYGSYTEIFGASGYITPGNAVSFQVDIMNYAGSKYKAMLCAKDYDAGATAGTGFTRRESGTWQSTSAINSLTITGSQNFAVGTTATIFGIKAA